MKKPRTHYQQVPLKIIKKIAGEQLAPELFLQQASANGNLKRKKSPSRAKTRAKPGSRSRSAGRKQ
jgi:hypothetical protein